MFPAAVLFALLASDIVQLLYGEQWVEAIPLVPWALCVITAGVILRVFSMLLLGNHNQRQALWLDGLLVAGTVIALVGLLPYGAKVYISGLFAMNIGVCAVAVLLAARARVLDARRSLRSIVSGVVLAICAVAVAEGADILAEAAAGVALHSGTYAGLFILSWIILPRALFSEEFQRLSKYLPGRIQRVFGTRAVGDASSRPRNSSASDEASL